MERREREESREEGRGAASLPLVYRSDFSASSASVSASYQEAAAIERNCAD